MNKLSIPDLNTLLGMINCKQFPTDELLLIMRIRFGMNDYDAMNQISIAHDILVRRIRRRNGKLKLL